MKKYTLAILLGCILVGACGCGKKVEHVAEEPVTATEAQWKSEYNRVVFGWQADYGRDATVGYGLIDLNGDEIPELVTFCDGEIFTDVDVYTYYNGQATRLMKKSIEGYVDFDEHLSLGGRLEDVAYYEGTGILSIYSDTSKMFYKMEQGALQEIIRDEFVSDDSGKKTYSHASYVKQDGKVKKLGKKKVAKGATIDDMFAAFVQKSKLETIYNFSLDEAVSVWQKQESYDEILQELEITVPDENMYAVPEFRKEYAQFLQQFLLDENNYLTGSIEKSEIATRLEYEITDLGDDGEFEILIRDKQDEAGTIWVYHYDAYWQNALIGRIRACNADATQMVSVEGDSWYHIVELQGNQFVKLESFEHQQYETKDGILHAYYHETSDGKRVQISEEEFLDAPFQSWTAENDGWKAISGESIAELLK